MKEFKLRFKESQDFFILINAIKALVDKATIELDAEKFHLFGMDPSHIVKIDLELSSKYFDDYNVNNSQVFSIELELLNTIMKRANKEQLTLSANVKENKLITFFKSETSEREFALGILSEPEELKQLGTAQDLINPDNCNFDLDTELLQRAIKDLSIFKEWAEFTFDSVKLIASATGDGNNAIISMSVDNVDGKKQTSMYSLEYLKDIIKVRPLSDKVNVSFRNEMPVILDFKFKEGKITYILAPRVESDEESGNTDEAEEDYDENNENSEEEPETEVIGK